MIEQRGLGVADFDVWLQMREASAIDKGRSK